MPLIFGNVVYTFRDRIHCIVVWFCCFFQLILNTGTCSLGILLSAVGRTASNHVASFVSPCFRSCVHCHSHFVNL